MSAKNSFRDSIATMDYQSGKRRWLFPRLPKGRLTRLRHYVAAVFLALFFILPFVRVHGDPFMLINIFERKFILFGMIFWPQDTYLFVIAMISIVVFVILFTVIYGRIWCGWACPQTIFMELIFRRIEKWIDGGPGKQKILKEQAWDAEKIGKRLLKSLVFLAIIFVLVNTFVSYFIGTEGLWATYATPFSERPIPYIVITVITLIGFVVYMWFREQVCVMICPYGRLQGVFLDNNSIIVAYDYMRGEPRAPFHFGEDRKLAEKGDCVNCGSCVQVCPTGIDIRNGTQLECVNCTACIDACNAMMGKFGMEKGLIRFASERSIRKNEKLNVNARIVAYSLVLVALLGFLSYMLITRTEVEATILRTPGMLYQLQDDGRISNLYSITAVNKSRQDMPLQIKVNAPNAEILIPSGDLLLKKQSDVEAVFFVILPEQEINSTHTTMMIGVYHGDELMYEKEINFVAPETKGH